MKKYLSKEAVFTASVSGLLFLTVLTFWLYKKPANEINAFWLFDLLYNALIFSDWAIATFLAINIFRSMPSAVSERTWARRTLKTFVVLWALHFYKFLGLIIGMLLMVITGNGIEGH